MYLPAALRTDSDLKPSGHCSLTELMMQCQIHCLAFRNAACNVGRLHNVAWTCQFFLAALAPAEDLVILPNLLLHHKFTDGLEGNCHCLGLVLDVCSSLLAPLPILFNVPAVAIDWPELVIRGVGASF